MRVETEELSDWLEPTPGLASTVVERVLATPYAVISGAPGSGKSRLIREARKALGEGWTVPLQPMAPTTNTWRSLALPTVSVEFWEGIWRILVIASVASFVNTRRSEYPPEFIDTFDDVCSRLPDALLARATLKHPFGVVKVLAREWADLQPPTRARELSHPKWDDLEEVLRQGPTFAEGRFLIEIDHLDDYFDNNPSVMAETQAGLARYLCRLADQPIASKDAFRVIATVRHTTNNFLLRVAGSDLSHAAAFVEMRWTKSSIQELLSLNLQKVCGTSSIAELSGRDSLDVPRRGIAESPDEYVLRHTTLTPRDAEQLSLALASRPRAGQHMSDEQLRYAVSEYAEMLASSMVHQVVSDLRALSGMAAVGTRDPVDGGAAQEQLKTELQRQIESLRSEALTWHQLQTLVNDWEERSRPHLVNCLWSYRMIGRRNLEDNHVSVSRSIADHMGDGEQLMLHPMLHDLCRLDVIEEAIVLEFV